MRFLVLGGTRFIGTAPQVVRLLANNGHAVAVFHRGENRADLPSSVIHLIGDRKWLAGFSAAKFARFAPDVVIDAFAMTEMDARLPYVQVFLVDSPNGSSSSRAAWTFTAAYDRFRGVDLGVIGNVPLSEDSPLRARRSFPTRNRTTPEDSLLFNYENILVERVVEEPA